MLVLSRQVDESLLIGDEISVKILEVNGDTVKIGIEAPKSVAIYRKELYEAITEENRNASQINSQGLKTLSATLLQQKDSSTHTNDE